MNDLLKCEELITFGPLHSNGSLSNWLKIGGIEWFLDKTWFLGNFWPDLEISETFVIDGSRNLVFG